MNVQIHTKCMFRVTTSIYSVSLQLIPNYLELSVSFPLTSENWRTGTWYFFNTGCWYSIYWTVVSACSPSFGVCGLSGSILTRVLKGTIACPLAITREYSNLCNVLEMIPYCCTACHIIGSAICLWFLMWHIATWLIMFCWYMNFLAHLAYMPMSLCNHDLSIVCCCHCHWHHCHCHHWCCLCTAVSVKALITNLYILQIYAHYP